MLSAEDTNMYVPHDLRRRKKNNPYLAMLVKIFPTFRGSNSDGLNNVITSFFVSDSFHFRKRTVVAFIFMFVHIMTRPYVFCCLLGNNYEFVLEVIFSCCAETKRGIGHTDEPFGSIYR